MTRDALDALEFLDEGARRALRHLGSRFATGDVVLFAGAGLSRNASARDGGVDRMPMWEDLAAVLRGELDEVTRQGTDPLKAADYYETTYGRPALVARVQRLIGDNRYEPGRVHRTLAELNLREIITTNYDTLIERAFTSLHLTPQIVVSGADLVSRRSPRIVKMNGCIERNPAGIVITTDDFLAFPEREPLIEAFVMRSFVESSVLFVGFALNDPTFRHINQRVRTLLGAQCPMSYSLQLRATDPEIRYWRSHAVELIALGGPSEKNVAYEERLHRVLRALLAIQRSGSAYPEPAPRAALNPTSADVETAANALFGIAPDLDRESVERELRADPPLAVLLGGICAVLHEMLLGPDLTPDGRNGAAILAARMLESSDAAESSRWLNVLACMLDGGATGWGRLQGALGRLSTAQLRQLQNNLLTTLARRRDIPCPDVVEWIGRTITDAAEIVFHDLEFELCRLLLVNERPYAMTAADEWMRIRSKRPEIIGRNSDRILRARSVLSARHGSPRGFRATSAFLRNVEVLAQTAAGVPL